MPIQTTARTLPTSTLDLGRRLPGASSLFSALLLRALGGLTQGCLELSWRGQTHRFGDPEASLRARVEVHDVRFFAAVVLRGSVGAGEAFMEGYWTTEDLTAVIRVFVRNQEALSSMEGGLARISRLFLAAYHRARRNDRSGSKKNITAHYDLSNEFFATFLDPSMMYSCALFSDPSMSLEEAQRAKLDTICQRLELGSGDHLLEIGTGWGALAIHAAREYGCRVTTTTISARQHALAASRIAEAGLQGRIELLNCDYRELEGSYDKLVSVEMVEAVGHQYYGTFFATCARLLKPEGLLMLQAITIADRHYEEARRSVDFIQRYIFPGSCIPSISALLNAATRRSDLTLTQLDDLTPHYARTLEIWRSNLLARADEVRALSLDDRFLRMWEFYFSYCEGGFLERHIGDVHMLFAKPRACPTAGLEGANASEAAPQTDEACE